MAYYLSPDVTVTESENGVGVASTGTTTAAAVITALWGPAQLPYLITNGETSLVKKFGTPTNDTYKSFFVVKDFTSYGSSCYVNRLVGTAARNSVPSGMTTVSVLNENVKSSASLTGIPFFGRYPGTPGNGLIIDIADKAKFANWAYASQFNYTPTTGTYAVAVIDSTGYWIGNGAANQEERLSISGTATGGVQQTNTITVSGSATGGIQQQEIVTFSGTATGTTITVNGTAVTLVIGDTATIVASKVATALAAVTATYASAVANSNMVYVTFVVPGTRDPIATGSSNGISFVSAITVPGSTAFAITLTDGTVITTAYGATAAQVTALLYTAINSNSNTYQNVTSPTTTTVRYQYVAYGTQTVTATQTSGGVTFATVATTVGSSSFTASIFGVTITLTNGMTATQVANIVAAALIANGTFAGEFTSIQADGAKVYYTWIAGGEQTANIVPTSANGITYYIDIETVGTYGSLLEKYELMSNSNTATASDGSSSYWYSAIASGSNVINTGDSTYQLHATTITLAGAVDDNASPELANGLSVYSNTETYKFAYLLAGHMDTLGQKASIDLVESRMDCVAYITPPLVSVYNTVGNEMDNIVEWNDVQLNRASTYTFKSDNWALVYDAYNNTNRWIPSSGGDAGLQARTTDNYEAWYSPAGLERGIYKNYLQMAWSASKAERDVLFPLGINSIVTFPGTGIVLWGDKTGTNLDTTFDSTGVRFAFIYAETNIKTLGYKYLFELNNSFTQASFLAAINSFLTNAVKRNAFEEFAVVIDKRNNTIATEAQHLLNVNIFLRPQYSIRFINVSVEAVGGSITLSTAETSLLGSPS